VGADVVEYNPRNDISNLTALVAAKLVKEIAGMMASKESQAVTSGEDRLPRD
jgi:arginase family enzyme